MKRKSNAHAREAFVKTANPRKPADIGEDVDAMHLLELVERASNDASNLTDRDGAGAGIVISGQRFNEFDRELAKELYAHLSAARKAIEDIVSNGVMAEVSSQATGAKAPAPIFPCNRSRYPSAPTRVDVKADDPFTEIRLKILPIFDDATNDIEEWLIGGDPSRADRLMRLREGAAVVLSELSLRFHTPDHPPGVQVESPQ